MIKKLLSLVTLVTILGLQAYSQSPTAPALGFNAFLQNNATLTTNESEGPIAIGGNLTVAGNYQVNIHGINAFSVSNVPIGLFVGGQVNLSSNSLQVDGTSYVKIGNCASSNVKVWYVDQNNAASNIYITGSSASWSSTPNINVNAHDNSWGTPVVSASNNPVCDANTGTEINFATAFSTMQAAATSLAACSSSGNILSNPNGNIHGSTISGVLTGGQLKITLASGTNVLNVSGSDLNSVTNGITFTNSPDANHVLVINVNASGSFTWNVWNQAGIGGGAAPYIIYNFYNTTSLNIAGNSTIEGTVFAPNADITKTINQSNIEGQVIGLSFVQSGGELHYYPFTPSVSGCAVGCTPTTSTSTAVICSGASYTFNGSTYSSAGTYTAHLTNKGGCDSTATLLLTTKSASASTTNASICSGGSYTFNGNTYSSAGTYTTHLTNAAGCDSVATLVLAVSSPSNIVVSQIAATCNSLHNPNYDGAITLQSASYATKFGISTLNAASYNGADYSNATTIGTLPTAAKAAIPNTGGTYILRVYGSDASCYVDQPITVSEVLCGNQCANTVFPIGSPLDTLQWLTQPSDAINMYNFYQPGSSTPLSQFTLYAPGNLTIESQGLTNYPAFCSDLSRDLYIGNIYTSYTVEPLEYLAKEDAGLAGKPTTQIPDGGIGPVRAGMVRYLVDKHFVSTNSTDAGWSDANNYSFAFQIALWEITHDQYNTSSINFSVKNASTNGLYFDYNSNTPQGQAVLDTAEAWVKDIQSKTWDWTTFVPTVWHAVALNTTNSQDLVTAEPISACSVPGIVTPGSTGGLESKSLGAAIGTRNFNMYKNGKNGAIQYAEEDKIAALKKGSIGTFGVTNTASLAALMPYSVNAAYTAYDESASVTDLTSITNAVDVRTVDFTLNNSPKAVAFATKTLGGIYSHTKPICDRLKGAQLLDITNVKIQGLTFMQYKIQQPNGELEYAISFSAGAKAGRGTYSIQSNWLMTDYASEDTMYNYQLWAATHADVATMVTEVLNKLKVNMPVAQLSTATDLPTAYVSAASRQGTNLNLTINNRSANTSGYFTLTQRATENSTSENNVVVPFTIGANGKTTVTIPEGDSYDANISMVFNNSTTDMLYMADGIWGTSGDNSTTVSQFNVSGNSSRVYSSTEYPMLRDVQVQATTPSYVSIYKYLKGGASAVNLTGYKTLKFTANTNTEGLNMKVTITKQGVNNWASQYTYEIAGLQDGQTYALALSDFKSTDNSLPAAIDLSDVTSVIYNVENPTGQTITFNAGISNAAFSTEDIAYTRSLQAKTVGISPNPNNGSFKVSFASPTAAQLNLTVVDNIGRIISSTLVNATVGKNEVSVNINQTLKKGVYYVSLRGAGIKYDTQKIIMQK